MLHYEVMEKLIRKVFGDDPEIAGLEIGVNTGLMEQHLLGKFEKMRMTGIDVNDNPLPKEERYTHVRGWSQNVHIMFNPGDFDFIYIDGGHEYPNVKLDLMYYPRLSKKKSIIAGHDYFGEQMGVVKAVTELFGQVNTGEDGTWWVVRDNIEKV